jgi:hypothetical protein
MKLGTEPVGLVCSEDRWKDKMKIPLCLIEIYLMKKKTIKHLRQIDINIKRVDQYPENLS